MAPVVCVIFLNADNTSLEFVPLILHNEIFPDSHTNLFERMLEMEHPCFFQEGHRGNFFHSEPGRKTDDFDSKETIRYLVCFTL